MKFLRGRISVKSNPDLTQDDDDEVVVSKYNLNDPGFSDLPSDEQITAVLPGI